MESGGVSSRKRSGGLKESKDSIGVAQEGSGGEGGGGGVALRASMGGLQGGVANKKKRKEERTPTELSSLFHGPTSLLDVLDLFLVFWFVVFAITSWVFEPYVTFELDIRSFADKSSQCIPHPLSFISHSLTLGELWASARDCVGWLWYFYANSFDPVFLSTPGWLRIMCIIDHFGFGTCYLFLLYGFLLRREWVKPLGIVYSSCISYSCLVYFAYEFLYESSRANLFWVVVINLPYLLIPLLLFYRVSRLTNTHSLSGKVFW